MQTNQLEKLSLIKNRGQTVLPHYHAHTCCTFPLSLALATPRRMPCHTIAQLIMWQ